MATAAEGVKQLFTDTNSNFKILQVIKAADQLFYKDKTLHTVIKPKAIQTVKYSPKPLKINVGTKSAKSEVKPAKEANPAKSASKPEKSAATLAIEAVKLAKIAAKSAKSVAGPSGKASMASPAEGVSLPKNVKYAEKLVVGKGRYFSISKESHEHFMEYELRDEYYTLAALEMKKPTEGMLKCIFFNDYRTNRLAQLVRLHTRVQAFLLGSVYGQRARYTEKFRHFLHLFFAEEQLELHRKFRQNVQVRYVCRRTAPREAKYEHVRFFAVFTFQISAQVADELVLYQMISINEIQGQITDIKRCTNSIEVTFEERDYVSLSFDENVFHCMEVVFNERQYETFMYSMHCVEQGKADFVLFPDSSELISKEEFDSKFSDFKNKCDTDPNLRNFDKQQQVAIFSIVNGIHRTVPFVLWGPPGTGKTVTLVECIRQLLQRNETNRILVCTPSNTAADLIARRFLKIKQSTITLAQMRRYYSLGKSVNDRDRELDAIIQMGNCSISGVYKKCFKIDTIAQLKEQNVRLVFTTLVCSSYLGGGNCAPDLFSHIFIDEAGQSIEPETLIPITRFATRNTRVVLCGDHQQLGPVVTAHFLKPYKTCHLSLIERLMTTMREGNQAGIKGQNSVYLDGRTFCQLTDCYRCHPTIVRFSSDKFYSGTLRAVNEKNRRSFCDWTLLPSKNFPVIFHALTKGTEVRQLDSHSYYNEKEMGVVLKYIWLLRLRKDIEDTDIGVISPYKLQTQKLRKCLANRKITVDSVECFQGSERRVIILTLSRSTMTSFLCEYKRINTCLTRAKELLIVVASLDFVHSLYTCKKTNAQHWTGFIKYCRKNNAFLIDGFAGGADFKDQTVAENVKQAQKCQKALHAPFKPKVFRNEKYKSKPSKKKGKIKANAKKPLSAGG